VLTILEKAAFIKKVLTTPLIVTLSAVKHCMVCPNDLFGHDPLLSMTEVLEGEDIRSEMLMKMPMQRGRALN